MSFHLQLAHAAVWATQGFPSICQFPIRFKICYLCVPGNGKRAKDKKDMNEAWVGHL